MRLLRLLLISTLLVAPGCLVVTCGGTRTFGDEAATEQRTAPPGETGRGSESRW